jgi:hypothetical protein
MFEFDDAGEIEKKWIGGEVLGECPDRARGSEKNSQTYW